MSDTILIRLTKIISERRSSDPETSYTRQLLDLGVERCAQKFGEEAVETVIAAVGSDDPALVGEVADLLYHLLVLLEARELDISDVFALLEERMGTSGLTEKEAR